jgi:hypothetical protein
MIQFNLNIDLFYEYELKNNSEVKAIACIEYPILHIIAKTVETMQEEYDELDKFIVQTAYKYGGFSKMHFSDLTGLGIGVFDFRVKELIKQQYISLSDDLISPIEKGLQFLNDPTFERQIERTRSFLLDGITLQPLKGHFYKDGKENLISAEEKDLWGNKLFNPAIIFNPPSKQVQQSILDIPVDERSHYNIPVGLKGIKDYDFVLMTYPVAIVLSRAKSGIAKKKLVDLNGFYADEESVTQWQKSLQDEIGKMEVLIEEKDVTRNEATTKRTQFKNNWGKTRTADSNRIFNITKDRLKYFIQKLYGFKSIEGKSIFLNELEVGILVDRNLFESEGTDKKKLIEACLRKRDYYRQNAGTGIWLIFLELKIVDEFIQGLVDLHKLLLREETSLMDLLSNYNNNYKVLRQHLIAIDRYDKLEELDIYLFIHSRETNFIQKHLMLLNE